MKILFNMALLLSCFTSFGQAEETKAPAENYKLSSPYLGIQIGSLGAGMQYVHPLNYKWNLRVAASYFAYTLNSRTETNTLVTATSRNLRVGGGRRYC